MNSPPRIIAWIDYTCPYSYVGTARIEWLRQRFDARVDLRTFSLHPLGGNRADIVGGRIDVESEARLARQAGLDYRSPKTLPNSRAALELTEIARAEGALAEFYPAAFRAYWAEGRDIGDVEVLLELAEGAGMNRSIVAEALADHRFAALVEASTQAALSIGVDGLPAWILDGKSLITGAEPEEVFVQALADLGHDVRPLRSVSG